MSIFDPSHDEFRSLLTKLVGYQPALPSSKEEGEENPADPTPEKFDAVALLEVSNVLNTQPMVLKAWARGTGRPSRQEESKIVDVLKGITLHRSA